jgi:Ca2+-binding RTX toxin-like protein
MNSGFTSIAKYVFDWETRFYQAQRLAQLNGIAGRDTDPLNPRNAIEHAYTSATLQKELGGFSAIPEILGNALEVDATSRYLLGGDDNRADSFRDLWNNAIGRQIGDYVRQNGLSQGDLEDLLIQAYNRGDLIPVQTDPRVPPNFSGWPGEFEQTQQPSWGGPSPGWTPSGGPGAVGDLQPPASGWPPPSDPNSPSDPSDASGPSDPSAPFSPNHPNPLQSRDPLVVDLNGNGVELTNVTTSNAHFDYGGTGFAVHTGWFAPTEGILIRDIDHNSSVTADELFGAASGNALEDLAAFDANHDGRIDSDDSVFGDLKIWQDANGDGVADPGELISLAQANIAAINLNAQSATQNVNGNLIVATTTFVRTDGSSGAVAEVNFATDTLNSRYTPPPDFQFSQTALSLPNLIGYGTVPDLIYSMSLRPDLEGVVRQFVLQAGSTSGGDFDVAFQNLVQAWTGADGVDPASRGPLIDARHLAVVEAFYGMSFSQVNGANATFNQVTANNIEATYQSIIDELKIRFVAQVPLSHLLNGESWTAVENSPLLPFASIRIDASTDAIDVNFGALIGSIVDHAPAGSADQFSYYDTAARLIRSLRVDLFHEDAAQVASAFQTAATAAGLTPGLQAYVTAEIQATNIIDVSHSTSSVTGTSGADLFLIGQGGHTVSGGAGDDSYVYSSIATGSTTIEDTSSSTADRIILTDINPGDVTLSRPNGGDDLVLTIANSGETLTVQGQFLKFATGTILTEIEEFRFADGTVWTPNDIRLQTIAAEETSGNDTVYGFHTADRLDGGAGNDLLIGNGGGDTFVFGRGYGHDTVDAYIVYTTRDQPDAIAFNAGVAPGDVSIARSGDDLILTISGTSDQLTIHNQFSSLGFWTVENFYFADGTTWTTQDIQARLLAGTPGDDVLIGFTTDDTLDGGAGNDVLKGRQGNDTYVFGRGYGRDVIDDVTGMYRTILYRTISCW